MRSTGGLGEMTTFETYMIIAYVLAWFWAVNDDDAGHRKLSWLMALLWPFAVLLILGVFVHSVVHGLKDENERH